MNTPLEFIVWIKEKGLSLDAIYAALANTGRTIYTATPQDVVNAIDIVLS